MLNVPRLNDITYDQIVARARSSIPTLTDEWTDFNEHDPGITTLEVFAWLHDTLNYYMNATGEAHRLKYLKLLGLVSDQQPACCTVVLEGEGWLCLPKGAQFTAGETIFEATEEFDAVFNRLVHLYCERDGAVQELTGFAGEDGSFAPIFLPDGQCGTQVYFGFEQPLSGRLCLYMEVEDSPRNPFGSEFSLATVSWAYYNGSTWQDVEVLADETNTFLCSGFVTLNLKGKTDQLENPLFASAHYLRCTLQTNAFDQTVRLGWVLPNCVHTVQQHTWARAETLVWSGEAALNLGWGVREDDLIAVAVEQDGEYVNWFCHAENDNDWCGVQQGAQPWERRIVFDKERFGCLPHDGANLLIQVLDADALPSLLLGLTDGCAGQRLEFDAENVSFLRLALVRYDQQGRAHFELWERCADIANAGYDDRVFLYDEDTNSIYFGDGLHGLQPQAGCEVRVIELKTSLFGGGNILQNQISHLQDRAVGVTGVYNPRPAWGGRSRERAQELEHRLDEKMGAVTRAVTAQDYQEIAQRTSGLRIGSVTVIAMKDYCGFYHNVAYEANTVLVAVQPLSEERLPVLSELYRKTISAYFERYRLLTTNIRVISARYVGISVYGRIRLREDVPDARGQAENLVRELVETAKTGEFGKPVDYGRLFSQLELCTGVRNVAQLSLEYIGDGRKNEHGDIVIGPDGLCYLREMGIEYL